MRGWGDSKCGGRMVMEDGKDIEGGGGGGGTEEEGEEGQRRGRREDGDDRGNGEHINALATAIKMFMYMHIG